RAWGAVTAAARPFAPRYFLARDGRAVVGAALILRPRALGPLVAPMAIVERGPVVADLENLERVLVPLLPAARPRGIAGLKVMPYWADAEAIECERVLAAAGFRRSQTLDGAHAVTMRIDLCGKTADEIFAGSERAKLRNQLRKAESLGVVARR